MSNFVEIFSNSVFSLLLHHSFPSIVSKLPTAEDVDFVGRNGFLISGLILIILPLTGCMAFGKDLGTGDKLIYYNFDFENKIGLVYWVTSFYVFLNVAAFSVYIIVIRTYILKMISPKVNPRILSSNCMIQYRTHSYFLNTNLTLCLIRKLVFKKWHSNCTRFHRRYRWNNDTTFDSFTRSVESKKKGSSVRNNKKLYCMASNGSICLRFIIHGF